MKAILRTRCGCTRMIDMDGRPDVIHVPFFDPYGGFYPTEADALRMQARARHFRIAAHGWEAIGGRPIEVVLYIEEGGE
jgi:hypothetical protein